MAGFKRRRERKTRVQKPTEHKRKQMLDMRRERYFRFDLDDMLEEFDLGDNKATITATIRSKAGNRSIRETHDYLNRLKKDHKLTETQVEKIKTLLKRYSKWR